MSTLTPSKCITIQQAEDLQNNWVATREVAIRKAIGKQDTREFRFSVAELEQFLAYVKENSTLQGISDPGIRIYFGAYNTDSNPYATVFLAPTKGVSADFDNNYTILPLNKLSGGIPPRIYGLTGIDQNLDDE